MTFQYCEPVVLPECPELDDLVVGSIPPDPCDTRAYEIAVAIARGAVAIIKGSNLMTVADTFVTIGSPGAWPDQCNVIGVGIIEFQTESDGICWTRSDPVFELLVSTCKPGFDDATQSMPSGGPLNGSNVDTLNGHALAFLRIIGAINGGLRDSASCFMPDLACGCCSGWVVEEVSVENSEACTEARFRIVRG